MPLPPLPRLALRLVEVLPSRDDPGFLNLRRRVLRVEYEDGSLSEPFVYDGVERERLDAVVIAPHFRDAAGRRHVYLRSALRPPVAARPLEAQPFPEKPTLGGLWELPAGLVEVDERSPEGLRGCAARELHEEVGFEVDPSAIAELGPSSFPAPGMIAERHFYFHVEVDPARLGTPPEDGSPLERCAAVVAIPLDEALALVRRGEIEDAKTELALRRLQELV
ncbi:MAG TPA: NUDIX hydrolase [Candidatus Nanopelagicales bacterium]|nr:NUDIX hydrolase [Candidatus Nanopelagicales bacterium]